MLFAQGDASFQLTSATPDEYVLQRMTGQGWFDVYSFDRARVAPLDIELANYGAGDGNRTRIASLEGWNSGH